MIAGIAHICFTVGDLNASIAFYEKLGFRTAFDFTRDNGERFGVMMHVRGRNLFEMFKGELAPPAAKQRYRHFSLEVRDIQGTVNHLRSLELDVTDIQKGSDRSWQAWVNDPDGNRIELQEYTPESKQTPWVT